MERFLTLMYIIENDGKDIQCLRNDDSEIIYKTEDSQIHIRSSGNGIVNYFYITLPDKNGLMKEFYPDGTLKSFTPVVNGLRNGEYNSFYESTKLKLKATFIDDKMYGTATEYYESGALKNTAEMSNNLINGSRKFYSENGMLKAEEIYQNNVLLKQRTYYENGYIYQDICVRDYKRHGSYKVYYPDGKLKISRYYSYGKKDGQEIIWDQYGNQIERNKYRDDVKI